MTIESPLVLEPVFRANVPPPNERVVPADPVVAPVQVPPFVNLSVPDRTLAVPELLNGMETVVVPVPADFWKYLPTPALLLNVAVPPNGLFIVALAWASQVQLLLMTAPVPTWMTPVPDQVTAPAVLRMREDETAMDDSPLIAVEPFRLTVPAPVIVPDDQVVAPETVTVSVPARVPPENVSVVALMGSPLLNVAVPLEIGRALPMFVTVPAASKFAVAPLNVLPDVAA